MASRQSEMTALVNRCRKANWEVVNGGSHWKVRNPEREGFVTVQRSNSSDVRNLANALSDLERLGLTEAEEKIKNQKRTENKSKNHTARVTAELKGIELATKASPSILSRASGPYMTEDEDVPLEWFITPHPAPWCRRVKITPKIARYILDNHNSDNRPMDPKIVADYRDIYLARLWRLTHQGVAFDTRGLLQDAQHRMEGLCEAAELDPDLEYVPFFVFVGMDPDNFKAIDEGRMRMARQLLSKDGEKNAATLQSVLRLVQYMKDPDPRRVARLRVPNMVILDLFATDDDEFRTAAAYAQSHYKKLKCNASALGAAHYLLRKQNGTNNAYVHHFFESLATELYPGTRIKIDDNDPRAAFRRRMSDLNDRKERRTGLTQLGMLLATWNNCVKGHTPRNLVFTEDSLIPKILVCKPGAGVAPHCFRIPTAG